jgi:hypothetical protein
LSGQTANVKCKIKTETTHLLSAVCRFIASLVSLILKVLL